MKNYPIIIMIASLLSACGTLSQSLVPQKTAEMVPMQATQGKGDMVTMPAQLRTITTKNTVGSYISCAEPGPDVALSDTFKLITDITASDKVTLKNDLQTTTTALELAGRTQTVLLAREFLYRTCEAASNGWITAPKVEVAHGEILKQITGLIETDKKKAETAANISEAVATGKLDPKILGYASTAVRGAIRDACVKTFEDCIAKPGADDKAKAACRSTLNECLK